jgi:hypothetical protein
MVLRRFFQNVVDLIFFNVSFSYSINNYAGYYDQ